MISMVQPPIPKKDNTTTHMAYVMPILPPSMNDWGDYKTFLLLPRYIRIECIQISHVITNHLPFTIRDVTIKPSPMETLRPLKEKVTKRQLELY